MSAPYVSAERFDALCREQRSLSALRDSAGIGTYNEKPLHKMLKRAVCEDESCFEVPVGPYVADVREAGRIVEIQTGGFYPLLPKLKYFLENTEDEIVVLHPQDEELMLLRIDPDTGELMRQKKSPKKEKPLDLLSELFYLREVFPSPRLHVVAVAVRGEEYRYSERMRGRKQGAYDAVYRPLSLLGQTEIATTADVAALLPDSLRASDGFRAEEFGRAVGLRAGRRRSAALAFLLSLGIVSRRKEGRGYRYRVASESLESAMK